MVEGDGAVGNNGATNGAVDWRAGLPEDMRADPALADFKDVAGLSKSYLETKRMVGGAFRLPKDDAPDAEWEAAFKKIAPDSIDKYEFPAVPDGQPQDKEMEGWFRSAAFEAGMHPKQAARLVGKYNQLVAAKTAEFKAEEEKGRAALKSEWGADYEQKVALANKAAPDAVKQKLHQVGLNADPDILRWLAGVSAGRREDGGLGAGSSGGSVRSRAVIKQEIDTIMATPEFAGAVGTTQKQHEAATQRYAALWDEYGKVGA